MELTNTDKITIPESGYKFEYAKLKGNTSQQTYSGKNLFDINYTSAVYRANKEITDKTIKVTATVDGVGYVSIVIPNSDDLLGKQCTVSYNAQSSVSYARFRIFTATSSNPALVGTAIKTIDLNGDVSSTFTFPNSYDSGRNCFVFLFYPHADTPPLVQGDNATFSNIQLELGSTATAYEPYVGSIPAPSPDYPQDIEVATGEQTITVAGKEATNTYTVNLGSLELCKIGNYQDYIYKSGEDWYVHKQLGSVTFDGTENWNLSTNNAIILARTAIGAKGGTVDIKSDVATSNFNYGTNDNECYIGNSNVIFSHMVVNGTMLTQVSDWITYLTNNHSNFVFPLNTETDTKITDATLIGQLEALAEENFTRDNEPTITVSSTNEGLIIDKKDLENEVYAIKHGEDLLWANANYVEPTPSDLPEGYTGYDFIKGDGTAYINTGVQGKDTISVESSFSTSQQISGNFYIVSAKGTSPNVNCLTMWVNNGAWFTSGWGNQQGLVSSLTFQDTYWCETTVGYDGPHIWTYSGGILSIDGTQFDDKSSATWEGGTYDNIHAFCRYTAGTVDRIADQYCKLYYLKLWDNDTLVRDFVPCTNDSNVAGLFDKVTQTFYGPANGGAFTAGND